MGRQGYRIRFTGDGEAIVRHPDPAKGPYRVSVTGHTFPMGCTCMGFQYHGRCKHVAVVGHFRPCDAHGCDGVQEYITARTHFGEAISVYECMTCHKTTDPAVVRERRDQRKRRQDAA